MRQMAAGIAEGDAGKRRRIHHLGSRLLVGRIVDRTHQIFADEVQRFEGDHIAKGIRALRRRTLSSARRTRAARVRNIGERLERVRHRIESR